MQHGGAGGVQGQQQGPGGPGGMTYNPAAAGGPMAPNRLQGGVQGMAGGGKPGGNPQMQLPVSYQKQTTCCFGYITFIPRVDPTTDMVQTAAATATAPTTAADDVAATTSDDWRQHATSSSIPTATTTSAADGCWGLRPSWNVPRPAAVHAAGPETKSTTARRWSGCQRSLSTTPARARWPAGRSDGSSYAAALHAAAADANGTISTSNSISPTSAFATGGTLTSSPAFSLTQGSTLATSPAFPFTRTERTRG